MAMVPTVRLTIQDAEAQCLAEQLTTTSTVLLKNALTAAEEEAIEKVANGEGGWFIPAAVSPAS